MGLTLSEISIRLLIATFFGSIIGWERENKSRPAGLRTHILVCVGATIIAMIQKQIMFEALQTSLSYPELSGIIRSDPARLICQVIGGIGFIGAGTIGKSKNTVHGLTTAASLWVTAVVGLSIGMGYYWIAIIGSIFLLFTLTVLKKFHKLSATFLPSVARIEIEYCHIETKEFIQNYFTEHKIKIRRSDFSVHYENDSRTYTDSYTLELPKGVSYHDIASVLSEHNNIKQYQLDNLGGTVNFM